MVNDLIQTLSAIPTRVLDLGANLAERFADPCHLNGGQVPFGVTRHTTGIEIGALVARRTVHTDSTEVGWASHHSGWWGCPSPPAADDRAPGGNSRIGDFGLLCPLP